MLAETAIMKLSKITGGSNSHRIALLADVPEYAVIVECSDEKTGKRFGQAKCRIGKCKKIGSGGRNKGDSYAYQVWADWSK